MADDPSERAPWEDDQVPYDDAMIAGSDVEEPPFDEPTLAPAASAFAAPVPVSAAPVDEVTPAPAASPQRPAPVPASPAPTSPFAASPFGDAMAQDTRPQTLEEGKDLLNSVFGEGIVFKSTDE